MDGGEEKTSACLSGEEAGLEAKGSSESESGISSVDFAGVLRRRGVAGAGAVRFGGDLGPLGDAEALAFVVRFAGGAAASFLGRPRGRFSA